MAKPPKSPAPNARPSCRNAEGGAIAPPAPPSLAAALDGIENALAVARRIVAEKPLDVLDVPQARAAAVVQAASEFAVDFAEAYERIVVAAICGGDDLAGWDYLKSIGFFKRYRHLFKRGIETENQTAGNETARPETEV